MTLPLAGVRIVAVEQYGAGPFGSQHLADLGADVIKVENPADGGDVGRSVGPFFFAPGDSHFYEAFNRNKRSITLNLKTAAGQCVLHDLVRKADATFDNLRGDLPDKLGLTYNHLKNVNPRIVCGHLSAYGRTGPRASWPGYDYLMQAEAGYLSLTGEPNSLPSRFGLSVIDMMTGATAALGLLAGIIGARASGEGRDIDVSLFDVAMHNLSYLAVWYLNEGVAAQREERSAHPSLTPSQMYRTGDGWIFIMCNKAKFWPLLVQALGRPEWEQDPRFVSFEARLANRALLTEMIDQVLSQAPTSEWLKRLAGILPVAPVANVAEALDNPFVRDRDMIVCASHAARGSIRTLASPVRCAEGQKIGVAPGLGEHTREILTELGYDEARIAELERNGGTATVAGALVPM